MRRVTFFFLGALSGGVLGAILALLFTPHSGDAMRREARLTYDELIEEAQLAAQTRRLELERQLTELTTPR
jgi:gas vesicle protein